MYSIMIQWLLLLPIYDRKHERWAWYFGSTNCQLVIQWGVYPCQQTWSQNTTGVGWRVTNILFSNVQTNHNTHSGLKGWSKPRRNENTWHVHDKHTGPVTHSLQTLHVSLIFHLDSAMMAATSQELGPIIRIHFHVVPPNNSSSCVKTCRSECSECWGGF